MQYDQVHALVEALKESPEYKTYMETRERAMENDLNRGMLKEMKRLQRTVQAQVLAGDAVDEVTEKKLRKLGETLQFNQEAAAYLMAEYNFTRILNEVYRIIAQGVGIELNLGDE